VNKVTGLSDYGKQLTVPDYNLFFVMIVIFSILVGIALVIALLVGLLARLCKKLWRKWPSVEMAAKNVHLLVLGELRL